ncbi:phosphoketolase family protein [Achromobacter xylosoxidans]|uniref:phosphoketolase family protein n=1 Tax=Alcaligenes xylosoxydans xylosoxydans TaxID=85698 RepID=UPI0015679A51|nr:phosphoketolase family protein [Achromobacter xylosoxidans]QKI73191.1 phosphoketolase family protein [Achromobacter xylosoxidans]WOB76844.1 phosphoketolase family protein [Achromobacter xylosoxidans]
MTSVPSSAEVDRLHAYWQASNYLCAGMLYLRNNALLRRPLEPAHIKRRILGHWGTCPGQTFTLTHLNRLIREHELDLMYVCGPGHGAAAVLAHAYLDGHYSERYPDCSQDEAGMTRLFQRFSAPGGIGSHCSPHVPGSIHEGGELGYSLSHAFGAAFDNPALIVVAMIGDGEAETGPLAASWQSAKFLNPARDGAVLPILHLNGYKIANPSLLARIPHAELQALFEGYGYRPCFVEGDDPPAMHRKMARALGQCLAEIRAVQARARGGGGRTRIRWPMIVLRTPKGWTGPRQVDGHAVENSWRAHQVPLPDPARRPEDLRALETWMRGYRPEAWFDPAGRLLAELRQLAPAGPHRISANPHADGGSLRRALELPAVGTYTQAVTAPAAVDTSPTQRLGTYLRDVMRANADRFRLFGPDETASNRLAAVYEASGKTWMAQCLDSDADGGHLAPDGRVMEILSEHTLQGWLEGYTLTGRHGLLTTYEAFAHVIDSMFNQHAKWLDKARHQVPWRAPVPALNLLLTSVVWRQDHNGFSHQDPGFLDVAANKHPDVVRIYLPPDANCLLHVAEHCLRSVGHVNVIVADKQPHPLYLDADAAASHCRAGAGAWDWAGTHIAHEPDVVMACAGDIPTQEALAAVALLRSLFAGLKIRFVNVVDLFKLVPPSVHPHGLSDEAFDRLFTADRPVIFNFHGYPALIHRLCYRRRNHASFHVHGYREQGDVNTPFELAVLNGIDRYSLAIDVLARVPRLHACGAGARAQLLAERDRLVACARAEGIDSEALRNGIWPTSATS